MTLRSGLGAQLGFRQEAVYGTYLAPTTFVDFTSESLSLKVEYMESEAIRTGTQVLRNNRRRAHKKGVEGSVSLEVMSKGFGVLLENCLGTRVITTPGGAVTARHHTVTIGTLSGKSMTAQVGRPDVSGVVRAFSYTGLKVAEWELEADVDKPLMLELSLDGKNESIAEALVTATPPANDEVLWYSGGTITVAGVSANVVSASLKYDGGLKLDRHFISSDTTKREQYREKLAEITGSLEVEFEDLTHYNRFLASTEVAVTLLFEGSVIETTFKYALLVTAPVVEFRGETPNVGGEGIVMQKIPFKVLWDGVQEPLTLRYCTTDTA